jgi:ubiquinone/menaquinone biosynthesis C-methylase UbiE
MELISIDRIINQPRRGEYALATGAAGAHRLYLLHNVYGPAGRRLLLQAGLRAGMSVADFGCGVGAVTRMLGKMVGPSGSAIGIDASAAQIEQATGMTQIAGPANVRYQTADACNTGLPRQSFDLVYCRFLLLHLTDPVACLSEMRDVLKPGGILVIEDGDLASACSIPSTPLDAFADLFSRLGPIRGVNYSIARQLYHMVKDAGFANPQIEIHQPAGCRNDIGVVLTWSVAEAGLAFVAAGLITAPQLERTLAEMEAAADDPNVLVLAPRMSGVWARKAA